METRDESNNYNLQVESAKAVETRQRRIAKIVTQLAGS